MLETPRMKLVKLNYEHMENHSGMLQDFHQEFLEKTAEACMEAENKIIQEFAEEEGLSLKCAEFFIRKNFRFRIEVITSNSMVGTPKFYLVLESKSVEEILTDVDTLYSVDNGCEKELLKKGG